MALKDFHDAMKIGVQKTLVAEDGMGHALANPYRGDRTTWHRSERKEAIPSEIPWAGPSDSGGFSMALKDFHDAMKIGVQKTLVAEDGMGHAFCKVPCWIWVAARAGDARHKRVVREISQCEGKFQESFWLACKRRSSPKTGWATLSAKCTASGCLATRTLPADQDATVS
jgi:hypothetical protein